MTSLQAVVMVHLDDATEAHDVRAVTAKVLLHAGNVVELGTEQQEWEVATQMLPPWWKPTDPDAPVHILRHRLTLYDSEALAQLRTHMRTLLEFDFTDPNVALPHLQKLQGAQQELREFLKKLLR